MDITRGRTRINIIATVMLLLALVLAPWARKRFARPTAPLPRPIPVSVVSPVQADLTESLVLPGMLESEHVVSVLPRVGGILTGVRVQEGEEVAAGEVLATVDPEPYELELKAAESGWKLAENTLIRTERMHRNAGASLQSVEEARSKRDSALSSYQLARMRLEYCVIRSPISGTVLRRLADRGNMASSANALFVIGDPHRMRVKVAVPGKYWDRFRPGVASVLLRRSFGETIEEIEAEMVRVTPSIAPKSGSFEVTVRPRRSTSWPIGSPVGVEFVLEERRGVWSLPESIVDGDSKLWRIDRQGMTAVSSRLGEKTILDRSVIIPESWSGDLFVLHGRGRLEEGVSVLIVKGDS